MTRGRERRRTRPRRRLPASIATSIKYGKELLETSNVPSRSAAIEPYVEPLHSVIDGNFRPGFGDICTPDK